MKIGVVPREISSSKIIFESVNICRVLKDLKVFVEVSIGLTLSSNGIKGANSFDRPCVLTGIATVVISFYVVTFYWFIDRISLYAFIPLVVSQLRQ